MGGHRSLRTGRLPPCTPSGSASSAAARPIATGWPALARRVEDLGWSTLTIADHFDDALAPIPGLMAAADATTTLRVGTMVLANDYRHPVVLAKEAATLDVLTGGRFELGIGAGWMTTDYEAAGIPLDRPGVRIEPAGRGARGAAGPLVRRSRAPSRATTTGSTASTGCPKPLTPGGPPIVIGGGGPRVLRLAGREADVVGINVNLRPG